MDPKKKYPLIVGMDPKKKKFKAGLALATLASERGGGYLNYSSILLMQTTPGWDNLWYPSLSFNWK